MFTVRTRRMAVAGMAALAMFAAGCSDTADKAGEVAGNATSAAAEAAGEATSAAASAADKATGSEETSESKSEDKASLADWDGNWISLGAYAKTDKMKPFAEEAAKEHGETVDQVLAEVEEARKADFAGLVIGDDKINFVDSVDGVEGASASEGVEYTFVESKDVKTDEHEFTWFIFEGGEGAPHKYVLLMPLHGEETLAHFHMRYGDTIEEAMNADEGWFPTFIPAGEATDEQIAETLFHHHH
ncbi:ZinT/AdcA family metal-binding protein [Corynebacterium sp. 335C]